MCNTIVRRTVHATATQTSSFRATSDTGSAASSQHAQSFPDGMSRPALKSAPDSPSVAAQRSTSPHESAPTQQQSSVPPNGPPGGATRTAQLFALAEQCDLQGLEAAIESIPAQAPPQPPTASPRAPVAPTDTYATPCGHIAGEIAQVQPAHRAHSAEPASTGGEGAYGAAQQQQKRVPRLDVLEADVVAILAALCRLAARQPAPAGDEAAAYIAAGKLLAADVLLKVLESPGNPWSAISAPTWATLRQPFCMVALRCAAIDAADSPPVAPRLFIATLVRTPLRFTLKAEMGAFFPLLLLKPLEMDRPPPPMLAACIHASAALAADAQLMVDLFVNYDCDLQAVNVFERWLSGLRRVVLTADAAAPGGAAVKADAVACVAAVLQGLSAWVQQLDRRGTREAAQGGDGAARSAASDQDTFEARVLPLSVLHTIRHLKCDRVCDVARGQSALLQ